MCWLICSSSVRPSFFLLLSCQVFGALRQRLEHIIQSRTRLAANLTQIKAAATPPQQRQQGINREVNTLSMQLRSAIQVRQQGGD